MYKTKRVEIHHLIISIFNLIFHKSYSILLCIVINIYFYSEEYYEGVWTINKNTARMVRMVNQVEDQVNIIAARYVKTGTKFRFNVWSDPTISLKSTDLPGTVPGTVTIPAIRLTLA